MGRGLLVRFAVGALVGVIAALAVGAIFAKPSFGSTAEAGDPVTLLADDGSEVTFTTVKANPKPLPELPPTATIQLAAFHGSGPSAAPGDEVSQPWWNDSVPRIPAISQFDGGPLASVNCLMAAAAMLARLGYGVVTTGTQVRTLSGDTDGGTTYQNAQDALNRGWGVRFFQGALTALQLRAVLWAGAGAIIDGVYGEIPVGVRLQASFTGRHAIYVDAFSPTALNGRPAYYVMDPIGKTWRGYKGGWWPAEDVERFAAQLAGGRIATMWAFPGGKVPKDHRVLPPEAYPSTSPEPGEPTPSASVDPFPPDDQPLPPQPPDGEPTGADPETTEVDMSEDDGVVWPGTQECLGTESKFGCPRGVVGIVDLKGLGVLGTPPPKGIDILYGTSIGPGMFQIIFEPPPDTTKSDLFFWSDVAGARLQAATVEEGTLDGRDVSIGTIILDPTLDYSFVATAEGDGVRSVSTIGGLEVKR